jgi:hypothetical protein
MDPALLTMSEEDLLAQIGRELEKDEVQALPQSVQSLRRRAERYLASKADELRAALCPNKQLRSLAEGGLTADLVQAVLTAIEAGTLGTTATPIAVLLCRQGLTTLCNESWSRDKK